MVELSDALEASGYSKAEISDRVEKFRDKLMQVSAVIKLDHAKCLVNSIYHIHILGSS